MNTKLLTTTFIGEYLEVPILDELLSEYSTNEAEEIFAHIVSIIGLSVLTVAFESIQDTHKRAAFITSLPKLLKQEISISELSRFQDDLPMLMSEHISRSLLSIRSKLRQ
ncbi:MAG: hypothetical protein H6773_01530 [Pseudomonadales bacterium]|nr:hypothetical protein [Pseudomonadales bacterium]